MIVTLILPATYVRQVNYLGYCQTYSDRLSPCDAMSLVYDLDDGSRVTVLFVLGYQTVAHFPSKACKFEKKDGLIVGVDCGEWRFRLA